MKVVFDPDVIFPNSKLNTRLIPMFKMLSNVFGLVLRLSDKNRDVYNNEFAKHLSGKSVDTVFMLRSMEKPIYSFEIHIKTDITNKPVVNQNDIFMHILSQSDKLSHYTTHSDLTIEQFLSHNKIATRSEISRLLKSHCIADSNKIFKSKKQRIEGTNLFIIKQTHVSDGTIDILYETKDYIYFSKSANLPCLPLRSNDTHTALHLLRKKIPADQYILHCNDPFLYRIDNNTSGLLAAAKSESALKNGRDYLHTNNEFKTYFALVQGTVKEPFVVTSGLENRGKKVVVAENTEKEYLSVVDPLSFTSEHSLVKVKIKKGMRHQIRVHLASKGFPIIGDYLYGFDSIAGLKRHYLHCYSIPSLSNKQLISKPHQDFISMMEELYISYTF